MSTDFRGSFTRGFAAMGEPQTAVCLLPGTEIAFTKDVEYVRGFPLSWKRQRIAGKVAQFQRVNTNQAGAHHDALQFPNGEIVLVTRLCPGEIATVLQLPAPDVNARSAPAEDERSIERA